MKSIKAAASWLSVVAGAWVLAACTPVVTGASTRSADANPITSGPKVGRCHMGGCGWFEIRSFDVVRETSDGALIRLDMRDGGSDDTDRADRNSSRGVKIDWGPYRNDEYVFCSTRLPAVISRAEGGAGWDAYRIDLLSPSGASQYVTNVYSHVCHSGVDMEAEGAGERLGYRRVQAGDSGDYVIRLSSPDAIFDHQGS
jgi:hypothetical protein